MGLFQKKVNATVSQIAENIQNGTHTDAEGEISYTFTNREVKQILSESGEQQKLTCDHLTQAGVDYNRNEQHTSQIEMGGRSRGAFYFLKPKNKK